ncbi:type I-G CRISPR-associated protein Csb2 [Geoalkalibacter sp.]|uniref:type I-G CRISPR-associated protein Csb2 n=1 Tax=Geoalkalibacter sp. TaxID=3041440 RepID=UPI00272ECF24|nr:type I-U CRISPR-associated protein Csb2 [Geoalkalibacter sp.]
MLAIGFRFSGGRYHATPWGRHVNEADVEWPPSPWRILRALIAVWHRKIDREVYPLAKLEGLLAQLAESLPSYRLPAAVHSHVRHYMPVREGAKDKNTLIFDAFVRISLEEELIVAWPDVSLDEELKQLLDELLNGLAYLGRAESWVEARRLEAWAGVPDCVPGDAALDVTTGEMGEVVPLFCPQSPSDYQVFRNQWQEANPARGKKKAGGFLPASWLEAVSLETSQLQAAGWSQPPAARRVFYRRPSGALKPAAATVAIRSRKRQTAVTTVRFALYGRPLPRLEDAVKIGELARVALMHMTDRHLGQVTPLLSGHDLPETNRHHHAFFLPECNAQGRIDHLLIHAPGGFGADHLRAMQKLNRLFTRDGNEWQVIYEGAGEVGIFSDVCCYAGSSSIWRSITPYMRPWHIKNKFGVKEQILRECRLRGLPEPVQIRQLNEVFVGNVPRRPVHFHRFRSKRGLVQPDTQGSLLEIVFPEQISGPLALGFACHFGLGLFTPQK